MDESEEESQGPQNLPASRIMHKMVHRNERIRVCVGRMCHGLFFVRRGGGGGEVKRNTSDTLHWRVKRG